MPSSPEQNFVRYRDDGDLAALAAVFDAFAAHLLLVAGHLVRDGALAEDLVQTTFVEAMRSASRYDAGRPLLPWLVRILTHHAKKLRRQRNRPADPRPPQRQAHVSAADHVLDQEVLAAVERALAELPVHYRQVLTLRLVHDLSPTAIAHALGCPPATVKTRLKRGLEQLRRQLPSGIATTVALLLVSGRGLAAVRTSVLLHAQHSLLRVARTSAWGLSPFGVLLMNQFFLRTGMVALVLVLLWSTAGLWWPGSVGPASAAPAATPAVASFDAGGVAAADAPVRSEVPPVPASTPEVVFHGRCLDAGSGRPMSGVQARAWWVAETKLLDEYDADGIAGALTDADGRFRLHCALAEGAKIQVRVGREDLLVRMSVFGPFPRPQEVDLGELAMHAGVQVAARVVDQRGQPVGGMALTLSLEDHSRHFRSELLLERTGYAVRSAADGTIVLPGALAPGRWEVSWYEDSIPPDRSRAEVCIPADRASFAIELICPVEDDRQAIRGVVVDERGDPVPGIHLYGEGAGTRGNSRSGWDGRFVMPRIGPYDAGLLGPVTITSSSADGHELVAPMPCHWGMQDLRLVVRTEQHLVVRAIDPRTGKPLRDAIILCAALWPGADAPRVAKPRRTTLADGAVQFGIARVPHLVQVLPRDPALSPSGVLRWEPGTSDDVTVDLTPTRTIDIVVVAADGEPVGGSEVWTALPVEADDEVRRSSLQDVPMPLAYAFGLEPTTRWERYGIDDAPLDHATTDASGRVRLHVSAHLPVLIAAFGPGHVPRAVVTPVDGERIELRVQRGASIRFELSPPELVQRWLPSDRDRQIGANREAYGQPQRLTLSVRRLQGEQDPQHWQPAVSRPAAGSTCTCDGLVSGSYDVSIYGRIPSRPADILLIDTLPAVSLEDGEERVVPIDLRRWAPGRLEGQVFVNGSPWAFGGGSLEALTSTGARAGTCVEVTTDADGRFEVDMVPGPCRFHLRSQFDHGTWWCAAERCSVVADGTTNVVFAVRRVAARVQIVTVDDRPGAGLCVTMQRADEGGDRRSWTTDEDGCFTIDPAPLSSFELRVASPRSADTSGQGATEGLPGALLGPVQVPPLGTTTEFRLRLPSEWR